MKRTIALLLALCLTVLAAGCAETPTPVSDPVEDHTPTPTATPTPMPTPVPTPSPTVTAALKPTSIPTVSPIPTSIMHSPPPYHTRSFADKVTLHIFLWGSKDENRYKEVLSTMREVGYIYEPEENADISLANGGITLYIGDGWQERGIEWLLRFRGEPCYVHIATLTEDEAGDARENLHCFPFGKRQYSQPREVVLDNGYIQSRKQFMGETVEMWELDPYEHNDTYEMWFMPDERHVVTVMCYLKTAGEREEMMQSLKLIRHEL